MTVSTRRELDAYYTPEALAGQLVDTVAGYLRNPNLIVEPSVGGGAFVKACRARWPTASIVGVDLDPEAEGKAFVDRFYHADFATWEPEGESLADLVIGNPPYSHAYEHVRKAHRIIRMGQWRGTVAFLLRLGFLAGQKRHPWWRELKKDGWAPDVHVLSKRPSFTGGGTDSTEYGLFVFGPWADGRINWLTPCT